MELKGRGGEQTLAATESAWDTMAAVPRGDHPPYWYTYTVNGPFVCKKTVESVGSGAFDCPITKTPHKLSECRPVRNTIEPLQMTFPSVQ